MQSENFQHTLLSLKHRLQRELQEAERCVEELTAQLGSLELLTTQHNTDQHKVHNKQQNEKEQLEALRRGNEDLLQGGEVQMSDSGTFNIHEIMDRLSREHLKAVIRKLRSLELTLEYIDFIKLNQSTNVIRSNLKAVIDDTEIPTASRTAIIEYCLTVDSLDETTVRSLDRGSSRETPYYATNTDACSTASTHV